jgi:hypothetical protein
MPPAVARMFWRQDNQGVGHFSIISRIGCNISPEVRNSACGFRKIDQMFDLLEINF